VAVEAVTSRVNVLPTHTGLLEMAVAVGKGFTVTMSESDEIQVPFLTVSV